MTYGYVRVSSDKQDTENQKLGINEKALKLGLTIEDWISDDGISGTKEPEERKLGKLLEKIKENDVIIVSELSRLGRKLFMIMSTHNQKLREDIFTAQKRLNLFGGEIPNAELLPIFKEFHKELINFIKGKTEKPEWLINLEKYYKIRPYNN